MWHRTFVYQDPWHLLLLPNVWQWSCHCHLKRLRSVTAGIRTPNLQLYNVSALAELNAHVHGHTIYMPQYSKAHSNMTTWYLYAGLLVHTFIIWYSLDLHVLVPHDSEIYWTMRITESSITHCIFFRVIHTSILFGLITFQQAFDFFYLDK